MDEYEARRFEREIEMTATSTRSRARSRFKPARLKLSEIPARPVLQRHSLHDQLVAKLREMILNNELRAGSALPEKMLCESFGVSRTPLREAFKVLASEGLIELRPHRTPRITDFARRVLRQQKRSVSSTRCMHNSYRCIARVRAPPIFA